MGKRSLQLQQMDARLKPYVALSRDTIPPVGWIKAIRTALGMSMEQLGRKLSVTKQAIADLEKREKDGSVTIKALKEAARAMDLQLVYGFVPADGFPETLVERKAAELATRIVKRTAQTMQLEDQANSAERLQAAVRERTAELKRDMPGMLWD